jgi:hypothetical protein
LARPPFRAALIPVSRDSTGSKFAGHSIPAVDCFYSAAKHRERNAAGDGVGATSRPRSGKEAC